MSENSGRDVSKIFFFGAVIILVSITIFLFGLYSGYKKTAVLEIIKNANYNVKLVYTEFKNRAPGSDPIHYLQPSRKSGSDISVNERADDGKLVLLSGFFGGDTGLRLIRRDGELLAEWPVRYSEIFPDASFLVRAPKSDRNVDLHGALINPDGSVVFNYEYGGTAKLSRCGEVIWTLEHPTHHSVERAEGGGYWIAGRKYIYPDDTERFPPFTDLETDAPFEEDLILRVSEDGEIVEQVSVPRILYDNGLEALLTAGGFNFAPDEVWDEEILHLNKIGELPASIASAFPMFKAGDLVLSVRAYNLLFVVEPDNWRVKWHQTGPWLRQHDPEFEADGTISIFNNNIYRTRLPASGWSDPAVPRVSNILKVDPATGRTEVAYGGREGQEFLSFIRGKQDPTPEGGHFVTEFEAGRAFETDAQGRIVWEYINRYDEARVLEMTEARLYPESYFTVGNWTCPNTAAGG